MKGSAHGRGEWIVGTLSMTWPIVLLVLAAVMLAPLLSAGRTPDVTAQANFGADGRLAALAEPAVTVEGTAILVEAHASPPRLAVRHDGTVSSVVVVASTVILLTDVTTAREAPASLDQIHRGDFVRVTLASEDQAAEIRASYRQVEGQLERLTPQAVTLVGGQIVTLADEASFFVGDRQVPGELLRPGMAVTLRISPPTGEVWEIRTQGSFAPRATPGLLVPPTISSVATNATRALGLGSTLIVTMEGTPGGTASFDLADAETGIPMAEGPPGRYTGWRLVRWGDALDQAAIVVWLRFDGVAALRDAGRVTIDGIPPRIFDISPAPYSTLPTLRPTIRIQFWDIGPAGADHVTFQSWIWEWAIDEFRPYCPYSILEDILCAYSEQFDLWRKVIVFTPWQPFPAGRNYFVVRIADRAGNAATEAWWYVLSPPATPAPTSRPTPTLPGPVTVPPSRTPTPIVTPTSPPPPGSVTAPPLRTPTPTVTPTSTPPGSVIVPPPRTPTPTVTPTSTPPGPVTVPPPRTPTPTPAPTPVPSPQPTPTPTRAPASVGGLVR